MNDEITATVGKELYSFDGRIPEISGSHHLRFHIRHMHVRVTGPDRKGRRAVLAGVPWPGCGHKGAWQGSGVQRELSGELIRIAGQGVGLCEGRGGRVRQGDVGRCPGELLGLRRQSAVGVIGPDHQRVGIGVLGPAADLGPSATWSPSCPGRHGNESPLVRARTAGGSTTGPGSQSARYGKTASGTGSWPAAASATRSTPPSPSTSAPLNASDTCHGCASLAPTQPCTWRQQSRTRPSTPATGQLS